MSLKRKDRPQSIPELLAILDSKSATQVSTHEEVEVTLLDEPHPKSLSNTEIPPLNKEQLKSKEDLIASDASNKAQRKKWWVILIGVLLVVGIIGTVMFGLNKPSITIEYASDTVSHNVAELTINANGVSYKMINVEGGTFTMGATAEMKGEALYDEKPTHSVTLSNYYIGETEVTQALWKAVMGNNPSCFRGDNLPVDNVSWDDCQRFIRKLNQLTGENFRLPTEAEWEYAARGGNKSRGYKYAGSNAIDEVAWCGSNSARIHTVAAKQANELGLYDMSGNVEERCQDWYGDYSSSSQTNPTGSNSGSYRVYRCGSWHLIARLCRSSYRGYGSPICRNGSLGFRLALSE